MFSPYVLNLPLLKTENPRQAKFAYMPKLKLNFLKILTAKAKKHFWAKKCVFGQGSIICKKQKTDLWDRFAFLKNRPERLSSLIRLLFSCSCIHFPFPCSSPFLSHKHHFFFLLFVAISCILFSVVKK